MRESTRADGPFVVLPNMLTADAAAAGAKVSYDPVAEVCYGPEGNQSAQPDPSTVPPAVIYVAPHWPTGE